LSGRWWEDVDYPGGRYTRTVVQEGPDGERCVFVDRTGRGCLLHSYALRQGMPVHDIKPMACSLFPVLWDRGTLIVPLEIDDRTLICRDPGHTLYRGAGADLLYYFGPELVMELDRMERTSLESGTRSGVVPLPLASA